MKTIQSVCPCALQTHKWITREIA